MVFALQGGRKTVAVRFRVKFLQQTVLAQIQRMMRVSPLGAGAGGVPASAVPPPHLDEVPDAPGQIGPLLDDRPPGRPDRRGLREGQGVSESLQILPVEVRIQRPLHVAGAGGPLGVDVAHDEAVKAVAQGDALHAFEGVVQVAGDGGGGIYPQAEQGAAAPGAQKVSVFPVGVGDVQPAVRVIVRGGGLGGLQGFPEV